MHLNYSIKIMRKIYITAAVIIVVAALAIFYKSNNAPVKTNSPLTASYNIEGQTTALTSDDTKPFGEPVYGDISNDGKNDAVLFITKEASGSGTFFYAVAATEQNGQWTGTNAVFLGDRIAPQNVSITNGVANFNFADRKENEPFTTSPSVGVTKSLILRNGMLIETK